MTFIVTNKLFRRPPTLFGSVVVLALLSACGSDSSGSSTHTGGVGGGGGSVATGGSPSGGGGSPSGGGGTTSTGGSANGGSAAGFGGGSGGAAGAGGAAVYPNCYADSKLAYACDASQSCVQDCSSCSTAPVACAIVLSADQYSARCVPSCAQSGCAYGGLEYADTCGQKCVDLGKSLSDCGSCGHACPQGTNCDQGHCCNIVGQSYKVWSPACNKCCPSDYATAQTCPAEAATLCEPAG